MIGLRVRRNFFVSHATFPNSGIRGRFSMRRFYARLEHKKVVGDDFVNCLALLVLFFSGGIVG